MKNIGIEDLKYIADNTPELNRDQKFWTLLGALGIQLIWIITSFLSKV